MLCTELLYGPPVNCVNYDLTSLPQRQALLNMNLKFQQMGDFLEYYFYFGDGSQFLYLGETFPQVFKLHYLEQSW